MEKITPKSFWKKPEGTTGAFALALFIDLIKILESYIEHLRDAMEKMNDHIIELSQEVVKLRKVVDNKMGRYEKCRGKLRDFDNWY